MAQSPLSDSSPVSSSPQVEEMDEISLVDILRFFKRQFKVIGGVTLAAVLVSLGLATAQKSQVQRTLFLEVELSPTYGLAVAGDQPAIAVQVDEELTTEIVSEGVLALQTFVAEYQSNPNASPEVSATIETVPPTEAAQVPEDLRMTLQAETIDGFETFSEQALVAFEDSAVTLLDKHIASSQERLDLLIERSRAKIELLESQAISPPAGTGNAETLTGLLQFQQQQSVLASEFSTLAGYEFDRAALDRAQVNADELVSIAVLSAIDSSSSTSLTSRLVLAAIAGFMLGIFVGIAVDQFPKLREALSKS